MRVKRDILRRSSIGADRHAPHRQPERERRQHRVRRRRHVCVLRQPRVQHLLGADADRRPREGDDTSYRGQLDYAGDRYGVQLEHLVVGDNFNPEVGFVRRDDIRRSFGQFRFSPRPRTIKVVRKFSSTASIAYIENGTGRLETRDSIGEFAIEFQNSDRF